MRELYELPGGPLLLVATDRISAFDYVLPTQIPDKGKILTQLSLWWFGRLADLVPNHLVDAPIPAEFAGRAMACQRLSMIGVECVARGYLAGSGWPTTSGPGRCAGSTLPPGLTEGARLPEPIFTPATKAPRGEHDENIPVSSVAGLVGGDAAAELERITLEVYRRGAGLAAGGGIIVADTKIELGYDRAGAAAAGRRGAHARFVPVLAGRPVGAGPPAAVVRQAVRARLAGLTGVRLGPPPRRSAAARTARLGGGAHQGSLHRGIRAHHG